MSNDTTVCSRCQNMLPCIAALVLVVVVIGAVGVLGATGLGRDPCLGILIAFAAFVVMWMALNIPIPVTEPMRKRIATDGLTHFTDPANRATMEIQEGSGRVVVIRESSGWFTNLLNPHLGKSAFLFIGIPARFWLWVNVCGGGRESVRAVVKIEGADVQALKLYWRPLDGAILIPHGYRGPGSFLIRNR